MIRLPFTTVRKDNGDRDVVSGPIGDDLEALDSSQAETESFALAELISVDNNTHDRHLPYFKVQMRSVIGGPLSGHDRDPTVCLLKFATPGSMFAL